METKFVLKASALTTDFIDGITKVFSKNAVLHITVEYGEIDGEAPAKTRGRKAGAKIKTAIAGKKRGPKPGAKKAALAEAKPIAKKRGRKAKNAVPAE